jgi:rfaE bifunctional protein nucleotidyltransferase chain/domain
VFTNGVFDLLHAGHIALLEAARAAGDALVVGVNADASVRRLGKGADRPLVAQGERARLLAALAAVDCVVLFEEDTPLALIERLRPDVLVKGADYAPEAIVGAAEVEAWGGRVVRVPLVTGKSTTDLVRKLRA